MNEQSDRPNLRLVVDNTTAAMNDADGASGVPTDRDALIAFPDIPETVEELTPELAKAFIAATESHLSNEFTEEVEDRLREFPDKQFAARLAIGLGEQFKSQNTVKIAAELDDSEETQQKVQKTLLKLIFAEAEVEPVSEPERTGEGVAAEDSGPSSLTKASETSEVDQRSHSQSEASGASLSPEKTEYIQGLLQDLNDRRVAVETAKTAHEQSRAKAAYDDTCLGLVDVLVSEGLVVQADRVLSSAKTAHGQARLRSLFDDRLTSLIGQELDTGQIDTAQRYLAQAKTAHGQATARSLFDREILPHLDSAMFAGDVSRAEDILSRAQTAHGQAVAQQTFDRLVLPHITEAISSGRTSYAEEILSHCKTPHGQATARSLFDREIVSRMQSLISGGDIVSAQTLISRCKTAHGQAQARRLLAG